MTAPGEGGREALNRVWAQPKGWRYFSEVNNTAVGLWYVAAGLGFFAVGGVLALLMRLQLAWPWMEVLGPEAYNQVFTMHGTVMMVVFAVP
ncbi:MAG: cbb3-type cytochrome c oxidase subunit I, partial [Pseudomonadota bacterium]